MCRRNGTSHVLSCRAWCDGLGLLTDRAHCRRMRQFTDPIPISSSSDEPVGHVRLAAAAYLGRFKGSSREHTESDLRCYLTWCAERGMDPLAARRADLELYIRWMRELRRFKPSTVSRRFSVAAGFYRTSVIDGVLGHSPAEHVRRPSVPPESPTLGFTRLQFEAIADRRPRVRESAGSTSSSACSRARRRPRRALHPSSGRQGQGAAVPPAAPADQSHLLA